MKNMVMLALGCLMLALCSCGGGGGTASVSTPTVTAVIKTSALTTAQTVAGIHLTISVPSGITPVLNADGSIDKAATVQIESSAPQDHKITDVKPLDSSIIIQIDQPTGFLANDTITIHLKITPGSFPTASDFKLTAFKAVDLNGATLDITPTLTTTIQ